LYLIPLLGFVRRELIPKELPPIKPGKILWYSGICPKEIQGFSPVGENSGRGARIGTSVVSRKNSRGNSLGWSYSGQKIQQILVARTRKPEGFSQIPAKFGILDGGVKIFPFPQKEGCEFYWGPFPGEAYLGI